MKPVTRPQLENYYGIGQRIVEQNKMSFIFKYFMETSKKVLNFLSNFMSDSLRPNTGLPLNL